MKKILTLLMLVLIINITVVMGSVEDIDADVIANVSFATGADQITNVNISSWEPTNSGYLYWFIIQNDAYGEDLLTAITGDFSETYEYIGVTDYDPFTPGHRVRVYRMGYVYNTSQYSVGGHVLGDADCADPDSTYEIFDISYSGGYSGTVPTLNTIYNPCNAWETMTGALLIHYDIPTYTLSGYVTDTDSGNPISSVLIELNNSGGSDITDDLGYYEITGISSGTYSISGIAIGYTSYSNTVSITSNTVHSFTMSAIEATPTPTETPPIVIAPYDGGTFEPLEPLEPLEINSGETILDVLLDLLYPINEIKTIFEETVTAYTGVTFNWFVILGAYVGALLSIIIIGKDISSIILYGTISWVSLLMISMVFPFLTGYTYLDLFIMGIYGFVFSMIIGRS